MEYCKHGWTVPDEPCPECKLDSIVPADRILPIMDKLMTEEFATLGEEYGPRYKDSVEIHLNGTENPTNEDIGHALVAMTQKWDDMDDDTWLMYRAGWVEGMKFLQNQIMKAIKGEK